MHKQTKGIVEFLSHHEDNRVIPEITDRNAVSFRFNEKNQKRVFVCFELVLLRQTGKGIDREKNSVTQFLFPPKLWYRAN